GRHVHHDLAQRDPHQAIDSRDDEADARLLDPRIAAEAEHDAALVLLQDLDAGDQDREQDRQHDHRERQRNHLPSFAASRSARTRSRMPSTAVTSTRSPAATGASARAAQYSPRTKTRPSGVSAWSARPTSPIISPVPAVWRRRIVRPTPNTTSAPNSAKPVTAGTSTDQNETSRSPISGTSKSIEPPISRHAMPSANSTP